MSVGRIIIEAKAAQAFAEKLAKKAARLAKGDPALPQTVVGPLINDEQVRKVDQLVRDAVDKGAELCGQNHIEAKAAQAFAEKLAKKAPALPKATLPFPRLWWDL